MNLMEGKGTVDLQIEPHIVLNTNGNTLRSLKHGLIKKKIQESRQQLLPIYMKIDFQLSLKIPFNKESRMERARYKASHLHGSD